MDHNKTSNRHGHLNRRSMLAAAGIFEALRPSSAWGQQPAKETHPSSARVVDRFKTRLSFQISVDVGTLDLGLTVATAAPVILTRRRRCGRQQGRRRGRAQVVQDVGRQREPRRNCTGQGFRNRPSSSRPRNDTHGPHPSGPVRRCPRRVVRCGR